MARILLSIALRCVQLPGFYAFQQNSPPVTWQGQLLTKFPWKLYSAHALPPVITPNPHLMQKCSLTTRKQECTRMKQPRTYEGHIFSPNISAYDNVILSVLRHWQKYNTSRKASCSTGPGQIQISNVITYCSVKVTNCLKISIYIEREKKINLTTPNDFDNTKISFCQSLLQRPSRTCSIHQQSNNAHYKTVVLLAKFLPM